LEIAETTWVPGRVAEPLDVTTVLGNLVENALEAARLGPRRPARVQVELLGDGADLHVTVADSGEGVPDDLKEAVFRDGVSTRQGDGGRPRGLGLALARTAARARGGDITLADPGEDDAGTVFVARLPEVLS
jgi:two-component system CitB family sensor kinase